MTAVTSGPWKLVVDDDGLGEIQTVDGYLIAEVGSVDDPEDHANGLVLAAAPDLLAALMDVLGPLASIPMGRTGAHTEQLPEKPNLRVSEAALHRARAAIRAAGGSV